MVEGSLITDEMRKAIGIELSRVEFDIEKVLVRRFLEAVEDLNPLWKGVVPPSLFVTAFTEGPMVQLPFEMPLTRPVDGGGEWEFFLPIKLGDTITGVRKFADIREREGKTGKMLFTSWETTWSNQRDEVVAKGRGTVIWR